MMNVDAAILMGDRGRSRPVRGGNKNFLDLNGLPLFVYVVQALERARSVDRIFIVGDRTRIKKHLAQQRALLSHPERITVLEQGNTLFDNAMIAFSSANGGENNNRRSDGDDRVMLFTGGDTPLMTPEEIEEFIEKCDLEQFDYFLGMSAEKRLRPFYPAKGQRGIKMAYFYVREKKFRINNLHLVKPWKIRTRDQLQKMYDYRYQKEFFNFLKLLLVFIRLNLSVRGIVYYLILHCNLFMARVGLEWMTRPLRRLVSTRDAEIILGDMIGCRLKTIETTMVGAALDIDKESDYLAMTAMFDQWREYQRQIAHDLIATSQQTIKTAS